MLDTKYEKPIMMSFTWNWKNMQGLSQFKLDPGGRHSVRVAMTPEYSPSSPIS